MKLATLVFTGMLATSLISCGGNSKTEDKTGTVDASAPAEESQGMELNEIASSAQIKTAFEAIEKVAGITDPELMELSMGCHKMPGRVSTSFNVQMVSPKDKNKIINYSYDFKSGKVDEPREVTLSSGIGSDEKFIDKYEDFKDFLFKKEDMVSFDKYDAIYKKAIEISSYKPDECYIDNVTVNREGKKVKNYLKVHSTKSVTAYKNMYFDKEGNVKM